LDSDLRAADARIRAAVVERPLVAVGTVVLVGFLIGRLCRR
jgi:hypothetical protein